MGVTDKSVVATTSSGAMPSSSSSLTASCTTPATANTPTTTTSSVPTPMTAAEKEARLIRMKKRYEKRLRKRNKLIALLSTPQSKSTSKSTSTSIDSKSKSKSTTSFSTGNRNDNETSASGILTEEQRREYEIMLKNLETKLKSTNTQVLQMMYGDAHKNDASTGAGAGTGSGTGTGRPGSSGSSSESSGSISSNEKPAIITATSATSATSVSKSTNSDKKSTRMPSSSVRSSSKATAKVLKAIQVKKESQSAAARAKAKAKALAKAKAKSAKSFKSSTTLSASASASASASSSSSAAAVPVSASSDTTNTIPAPKAGRISFPINEECTSLKILPSGRLIIAGFTDGTLRLFDTTGRLWAAGSGAGAGAGTGKYSKTNNSESDEDKDKENEMNALFDSDSEDECDFPSTSSTKKKGKGSGMNKDMVESKSFQKYGAVACQIHARGVITSLLMDVDVCQDSDDNDDDGGHNSALYCFGGVLRGSTELVAVDLSAVEEYHDACLLRESMNSGSGTDSGNDAGTDTTNANPDNVDLLDLIQVYRHSDAKLKGFGAAIRLKQGLKQSRVEYRLFTGKGIKNMHIWSFVPPQNGMTVPSWQCLYDTPTNGNTITSLSFRRDAHGLLQGISKSDDQKMRIWDLSHDEHDNSDSGNDGGKKPKRRSIISQLAKKAEKEEKAGGGRPKRPPYIDVVSTEHALAVCGSYVFSGGDCMYNKMGVMYLDVEDIQSPFNHTEFGLPNKDGESGSGGGGGYGAYGGGRSARRGRQQRGDLKSVVAVAGMTRDATNVILELSDRSLIHYCQKGNQSTLAPLDLSNVGSYVTAVCSNPDSAERKICVSRLKKKGSNKSGGYKTIDGGYVSILSMSSYDTNKDRGSISIFNLSEEIECASSTQSYSSLGSPLRFGFTERRRKIKKKQQMMFCTTVSTTPKQNVSPLNEDNITSKKSSVPHAPSSTDAAEVSPLTLSKPVKTSVKASQVGDALVESRHITKSHITKSSQEATTPKNIDEHGSLSMASKAFVKLNKKKVSIATATAAVTIAANIKTSKTDDLASNIGEDEIAIKRKKIKVQSKKRFSLDNDVKGTIIKAMDFKQNATNTSANLGPPAPLSRLKVLPSRKQLKSISISVLDAKVSDPGSAPDVKMTNNAAKKSICSTFVSKALSSGEVTTKLKITADVSNITSPSGCAKKIDTVLQESTSASPSGKRSNLSSTTLSSPKAGSQHVGQIPSSITEGSKTEKRRLSGFRDTVSGASADDIMVTPEPKKRRTTTPPSKRSSDKSSKHSSTNTETNSISPQSQSTTPVTMNFSDTEAQSPSVTTTNLRTTETKSSGTAVSPDCKESEPKTSVNMLPQQPGANSITKFFSKQRESSAKNDKKQRKKVQFKKGTPVNVVKKVEILPMNPPPPKAVRKVVKSPTKARYSKTTQNARKIPVQEMDVVSALFSLRQLATDSTTTKKNHGTCSNPKSKSVLDVEDYFATCRKRKRPCHSISLSNVATRVGMETEAPFYQSVGTKFNSDSDRERPSSLLKKTHHFERRQMAMHHRASHERLRSMILSSSDRIMNIVTGECKDTNMTKSQIIEYVKQKLSESLSSHKETLDEMLDQQRLQASSLAIKQTCEGGEEAPMLAVSFPFPESFHHATQSILEYFSI